MLVILDLVVIFNFILWLFASVWAFRLGTKDTIPAGLFISYIYYGFWNHDLWLFPAEMLSFHMLMLMAMVLTRRNKFWRIFFLVSFIMAVSDSFWMAMPDIRPWLENILPEMGMAFPYSKTWWQTLLDILFWFLCAHTLILNYHTHNLDKFERKQRDGYIWAYVGDFVLAAKELLRGKVSGHPAVRKGR